MRSSSATSSSECADPPARARLRVRPLAGRLLLLLLAFQSGAGLADAYVRISIGGRTLYWDNPQIDWQLNPVSFTELDPGELSAAANRAFAAWSEVPGSALDFRRLQDSNSRNDPGASHLIYLDPSNQSGFFPQGSGVVALTPITYALSGGRIQDVDVIFNGRDYAFTVSGENNAFDFQDVLTHEIGHMAGLDHSPHHGSSLWPYVAPGQWLHRSLSQDDLSGAVTVARAGNASTLKGRIVNGDGTAVKGGAVAAVRVEDGRLAATALSGSSGNWTIRGMPAGDYYVYAYPLVGSMTRANLTGDGAVQVDFGATFYGGTWAPQSFSLSASTTTDCGSLTTAAATTMEDQYRNPLVLAQGEGRSVTVWGSGFQPQQTSMSELSPYLSLSGVNSNSATVSALLQVSNNCPPGSYDLYLTLPDGDLEVIPGALEVVGPAPELTGLSEVAGDVAGGEDRILEGRNLQPGAEVLIGGRVASGVVWLDAGRLALSTPPGEPGAADVVVIQTDGQEARLENGFLYSAVPIYESVFPRAGARAGGTALHITGSGFAPGITVLFGERAGAVVVESERLLRVTAPAAASSGAVDVELRNPDGVRSLYPALFRYVDAPDPEIDSFTPGKGGNRGGTQVKLFGENLQDGARVKFGVDPLTAQGGQFASSEVVSAQVMRSTTPSGPTGTYGVLIEMPNGQGALAQATFQYQSSAAPAGGGGCGGVIGLASGPRPGPEEATSFLLMIGAWFLLRRRLPRTAASQARFGSGRDC